MLNSALDFAPISFTPPQNFTEWDEEARSCLSTYPDERLPFIPWIKHRPNEIFRAKSKIQMCWAPSGWIAKILPQQEHQEHTSIDLRARRIATISTAIKCRAPNTQNRVPKEPLTSAVILRTSPLLPLQPALAAAAAADCTGVGWAAVPESCLAGGRPAPLLSIPVCSSSCTKERQRWRGTFPQQDSGKGLQSHLTLKDAQSKPGGKHLKINSLIPLNFHGKCYGIFLVKLWNLLPGISRRDWTNFWMTIPLRAIKYDRLDEKSSSGSLWSHPS